MDLPPILPGFSAHNSSFSGLWQGVGQAFGHVWKIVSYISSYPADPLISGIQRLIRGYFYSTPPKAGRRRGAENSSHPFSGYWKHVPGLNIVEPINGKSKILEEMKRAQELLEQEIQKVLIEMEHSEESEIEQGSKEQNLQAFSEAVVATVDLCKVEGLQTWQEILDLTDQLKEELAILRQHRSQVEECSELRQQVEAIVQESDSRIHQGERDLCAQVKSQYQPNVKIKSDGHCLFSSIDDQLKLQKGAKYYRKLAADFMRAHPTEFIGHIRDALKCPHVEEKAREYKTAQGGQQAWRDKLEQTLGRPPNLVDYYCECLEEEGLAMWGGYPEILALSKHLEVSILVFTGCGAAWRFDVKVQQAKDQPYLLLFYNGTNHYQSLISKKKKSVVNITK